MKIIGILVVLLLVSCNQQAGNGEVPVYLDSTKMGEYISVNIKVDTSDIESENKPDPKPKMI